MNGRLVRNAGITLLELLVVIGISGILVGVIALTLQTSLDTYHAVQDDIFLQKVLDDSLQVLSDGSYEEYGIKDSLEVVSAGDRSISFVPPWVDESHLTRPSTPTGPFQYVLNRPFKAGSGFPIGEVRLTGKDTRWRSYPLIFNLDEDFEDEDINDRVSFKVPVPPGDKARFTFFPDTEKHPDGVMTIVFDKHKIMRSYKSDSKEIPRRRKQGVLIKDLKFKYFDNLNNEILPDKRTGKIAKEQLTNITAVKADIMVKLEEKEKRGSVFMSLRNSRSAGFGLVIRPGTKLKIPNSFDIRAFSLVNIVGVREGDKIKLRAIPDSGQSWTIDVELGLNDGRPVIRRYFVQYPSGSTVFSEQINLTTDLPLNLLALGGSGRYDYDVDKEGSDAVVLEGSVELSVVQMDPAGAALFVRP